ncbi:MAG: putative toxin-antitoxin system toxin component, PIN family [Bryobacteraceae bacterium]
MILAVLDANVLVSAMISSRGAPAQLVDHWRTFRFTLCVSAPILREIARVLRYPRIVRKLTWSPDQIQEFLDLVREFAYWTPGSVELNVVPDDPSDNRYLECAVEGGAHYIVSGDRHLLDLARYRNIRILTPRDFLAILETLP